MLKTLTTLCFMLLTHAQNHGMYFKKNPRCGTLFTANIQTCLKHYTTYQSAISNIHSCIINKFSLCIIRYNSTTDTALTFNSSLVRPIHQGGAPLHYHSLPAGGYLLPFCGLFGNFWTFLNTQTWTVAPPNNSHVNFEVLKFHLPASVPECTLTGLRMIYENITVHCGSLAPWSHCVKILLPTPSRGLQWIYWGLLRKLNLGISTVW